MRTKVVVQQRRRLFRDGLGQLVEAEDDLELVGTAASSGELVTICEAERPNVALLEADAVEWDVGRLTRSIRRAVSGLRVIGLSAAEMSSVELSRARHNGIRAVLPRSAGIGQILDALRATSPVVRLRQFPPTPYAQHSAEERSAVLTTRELTILNLVGAGFTSREISGQLAISHKTVENHKQRIFGKLGVQNQAHAVSVAMRRGLMRPERVIGLSLAD
ncbi:MAG TPA: response regulator transcription factor [Acidimicrobiales bacterium]|jgi:DNA-binding NarL/FixJ family response regulator|nr:response regulator transcription factor [Acidimicrobiales bacterium]